MNDRPANKSASPAMAKKESTPGRSWPPEFATRLSRARLLGLMRRRQPGDWIAL